MQVAGSMNEDEQVREIFALFGLSLYQCQCAERELALLIAAVHNPNMGKMSPEEFDAVLAGEFKKTFGAIIKALENVRAVEPGFSDRLLRGLETRNWLTHNYFWERAGHFPTEEGRYFMMSELREAAEALGQLDAEMTTVTWAWGQRHGVTEEILHGLQSDLMAAAIAAVKSSEGTSP